MTTFYDNDESHDESEDYSDDEDSLEKEEDSIWNDFKGAWRQHVLAIFVAVLAATYFHVSSTHTASFQRFNAYMHEWMTGMPHPHVHVYKRTANISFCSHHVGEYDPPHPSSSLTRFDFQVPREYVHVMESHFRADVVEIDDYKDVWSHVSPVHSPEYACLRERASTAPTRIKGYAWGYQTPPMTRMFPAAEQKIPASLSFTGFAAKFVNLGPTPLLLHWDGRGGTEESSRLVGELAPFQALGTATTPGQSFYVSPIIDSKHALQRWTVTADTALVVYDPFETNNKKLEHLTERERLLRDMQLLNLEYARDYKVATKRTWLAHFPRPHPMHPMRPANFVGQVQRVELNDGESTKEYNVKVASVTPRVFTIDNFLSKEECRHIIEHAQQQGLEASTVVSGGSSTNRLRSSSTRSSFNAWIAREASNTTDAIYRRAASLLGMDESLFRHRSHNHLDIASHNSLAESMQVVRYQKDQEYTAHHDFTHPYTFNRHQPTRFVTLLLYLNEPKEGGETVFPRAVNPTNHDGLSVTPKRGMAVLFYNLLPDGNMDDLSQHASTPVVQGEKWLANLWVWDPIID